MSMDLLKESVLALAVNAFSSHWSSIGIVSKIYLISEKGYSTLNYKMKKKYSLGLFELEYGVVRENGGIMPGHPKR